MDGQLTGDFQCPRCANEKRPEPDCFRCKGTGTVHIEIPDLDKEIKRIEGWEVFFRDGDGLTSPDCESEMMRYLVVLRALRQLLPLAERLADLEWGVHDSLQELESQPDEVGIERVKTFLRPIARTKEQITEEFLALPHSTKKPPRTLAEFVRWNERPATPGETDQADQDERKMVVGGSSLCYRCHRVHPAGPCDNFGGSPEVLGPWKKAGRR